MIDEFFAVTLGQFQIAEAQKIQSRRPTPGRRKA